jgi:hypothetical protein
MTKILALAFILHASYAFGAQITIGYEGPLDGLVIAAAIKNGYFKEDYLDILPVPIDVGSLSPSATDNPQAFITSYRILELANKGLAVKVTAGLYSGFLEIIGKKPSPQSAKITIASADPSNGPAAAARRYYRSQGVGEENLTFAAVPAAEAPRAILEGKADVFARFEDKSKSHASASPSLEIIYQATSNLPTPSGHHGNPHAGHRADHHFFDSFVVILADRIPDPETQAAVSRNLIRGARWVGENPESAAKLLAGKPLTEGHKYTESEISGFIKNYMWMPGVKQAADHRKVYIRHWSALG